MRSNPNKAPRVLYVVYWGALEPLGRSLVLPAVGKLSGLGANLTLVTFEKPSDLADVEEVLAVRTFLEDLGVQWIPLGYHKRPKIPATAFDVVHGWAKCIFFALRSRPDIVHARTFVGGLIGAVVARVFSAKLIYHNEGFYPDEQVDGGTWRAGSAPHLIAKFVEQGMYNRADGIIAMSNRAVDVIQAFPTVRRRRTPVIVVPSCVDLDHFHCQPTGPDARNSELRLVYVGSVGGRYILDRIGRFVAIAAEMVNGVKLRVLTGSEPRLVASMLESGGLDRSLWSLDSVGRDGMPFELSRQDAGFSFLTRGLSEHGCSPTKIGEYWAMGLPVITTPNVSDTDEIIRGERVGVIVRDHSDVSYRDAVADLLALLEDPQTPERCRRAAEIHYALDPACRRQAILYDSLCLPGMPADV
jgi:glycosyltransferase involved in cell wall biosynthesis